MYKTILAASFLATAMVSISGCNDKVENKTVTHYASQLCSVESIAGKLDSTVYVQRNTVEFKGWAVDTSKQAAPDHIVLRLTGFQGIPNRFDESSRNDRPDVAKVYNNEKLMKSGFTVNADLSKLEPGAYGIIIEIPDGKTLLVCQPKKNLVIQ